MHEVVESGVEWLCDGGGHRRRPYRHYRVWLGVLGDANFSYGLPYIRLAPWRSHSAQVQIQKTDRIPLVFRLCLGA